MTTHTSWFVTCDRCGDSAGWSHNEETARQEVRRHGWIRIRQGDTYPDLCWRCVEAAEEWANAIEFGPEVQP